MLLFITMSNLPWIVVLIQLFNLLLYEASDQGFDIALFFR